SAEPLSERSPLRRELGPDPSLQPLSQLPVGRRAERGLVPPPRRVRPQGPAGSVRDRPLRSPAPAADRSDRAPASEGVRGAPPSRGRGAPRARGAAAPLPGGDQAACRGAAPDL